MGKTSRGSQLDILNTISQSNTSILRRIIRLPCPVPPMLTVPLLAPLTRGPHVIHHSVDAERSPHHKEVVDRQSHYYFYIYFCYDTNATRVPIEIVTIRLYPAELHLCATAITTTKLRVLIFEKNMIVPLFVETSNHPKKLIILPVLFFSSLHDLFLMYSDVNSQTFKMCYFCLMIL